MWSPWKLNSQAHLNRKGSEGYGVVHSSFPSQASPSTGSRHQPAPGFREVPLSFCGASGLSSLLKVTSSSWCDFLNLALTVPQLGNPLSPGQTMVVGDPAISSLNMVPSVPSLSLLVEFLPLGAWGTKSLLQAGLQILPVSVHPTA